MSRCAREAVWGTWAEEAELGSDGRPRGSGLAGSGDGCGKGGFGGPCLLVGGGDPAQDVELSAGWYRDWGLAFAKGRACRVARRAQRDGAELDGRGQRAPGPAGWVVCVVAQLRTVNEWLTVLAGHDGSCWAGRGRLRSRELGPAID